MQDRRPDRALVIGGTLFIGRALVRRLLARGDDVTILHRGTKQPFAGQAAEILCDRNDTANIAQKLNSVRFDVVYDNVYDWQRGTTAEQVEAAALAAAPGLRRYVFTSSVAAYGEGLNLSEDHPLAPEDHPEDYVRNKAQTERMLFRLHEDEGLPAATLRPPYVYGPENPFYREAFFWDRLLADRPILLPDDGERLMQFVLADDLARAAILAADTDVSAGRAYNIAHDISDYAARTRRSAGGRGRPAGRPRARSPRTIDRARRQHLRAAVLLRAVFRHAPDYPEHCTSPGRARFRTHLLGRRVCGGPLRGICLESGRQRISLSMTRC